MKADPTCPRCGGPVSAPGAWSSGRRGQWHGAVSPPPAAHRASPAGLPGLLRAGPGPGGSPPGAEGGGAPGRAGVCAGGLVGGVLGPTTSRLTVDLLPQRFLGAYLALILFLLVTVALLRFIRIPDPSAAEQQATGRPLS